METHEYLIERKAATGSLRNLLIILFKNKYSMLMVFLLIIATVSVVTFLLPSIYEAKASLLVKFGREYTYRFESEDSRPMVSLQSFNNGEAIRSEIEILTSEDLIKKVIDKMGVSTLYPDITNDSIRKITPLQAAVIEFQKDTSIENINRSNVIQVSIQNKDPKVAARAANLLVEFFKRKHIEVLSNPKSSFLEQQLKTYKQKLKGSEDSLEAFKQKHNIHSLDEQRSLLLVQSIELDNYLKTTRNRIEELKILLLFPKNRFVMSSNEIPFQMEAERYKLVRDAKSKLLALQLKEQGLLIKYNDSSRLITNIREEVRIVKEFIENQENIFAEAELSSLEVRAKEIKKQIESQENQIKDIDMRAKKLHILKRNMTTNEKNYEIYLKKYEKARILEDMDHQKIANISVIQKAIAPAKPVKPRIVFNIGSGMILGGLIALGVAFIIEYFSQIFSTPERAERRLKLPVLTTISYKNQ